MAIKLYDDAIVALIKEWVPENLNIQILKPNEVSRLFQIKNDQELDKPLELPLIAISRKPRIKILDKMQPRTFDSVRIAQTANKKRSVLLNHMDVEIGYQIDIFTKEFDDCDEYVRDIAFKFKNHPHLKITIPYNGLDYSHTCIITLDDEIEDTSDIPERLFADEFTRFTIGITIDDAKLWSVPLKVNYKLVECIFQVEDKENNIEDTEIVKI